MDNKILQDVKMYLGINPDPEDDTFDTSIVMFINSAIDDLARIGLGEIGGFQVKTKSETWADYLGDYADLVSTVKAYISIYTRLHFDSLQGSLEAALQSQLARHEFTIQTAIEQKDED